MQQSPEPINIIELGSGVGAIRNPFPAMFVSPLEIVVEPLKNPFPVLIVSWTVAPSADTPVNQVPLSHSKRGDLHRLIHWSGHLESGYAGQWHAQLYAG